jgi:hypothetical protein
MLKLEQMTSAEVLRAVESGADTVVIPFGSIEQHGGHLPVGSDALLADVVGEAVAARLNALLAPTVRVACAERYVGYAGTLSLPAETLRDAAFHMGGSLIAQGFRVIALISTHGGNQAALEEAALRLNQQHQGVTACAPRGDIGPTPGSRSGIWLTSVMLSMCPRWSMPRQPIPTWWTKYERHHPRTEHRISSVSCPPSSAQSRRAPSHKRH